MTLKLRRHAPLALFVAFGFLAAGATDASGLHGCPHHDLVAASAAPHAGGDREPGDAPMASMGGHGAGHASQDAGDDGHQHGPCTCVGICNAGSSAPPAPRIALPTVTPAEVLPSPLPAVERDPATRPGGLWALHLPNAPPLSA